MAHLIRMPRAVWRRQPQGAVALNAGHEAAAFIAYLAVGNAGFNLRNGEQELVSGTVTAKVTQGGIGAYSAGSSSNFISLPTTFNVGTDYSLLNVIVPTSTEGNKQVVCCDNYLAARRVFSLYRISQVVPFPYEGFYYNSFDTSNAGYSLYSTSSIVMGSPTPVLMWAKGINNGLYSGNEAIETALSGSAPTFSNSDSAFKWFKYSNDNLFPSDEPSLLRCIFSSSLTDSLRKSLIENPWQLLKPRPSRFILIPSVIPVLSSPFFTSRIPKVTLTF